MSDAELDQCFVEFDGPSAPPVEVNASTDEDAAAALEAFSPWALLESCVPEVVMDADEPDWLEVRRHLVGDVAMAVEFGAPLLPKLPSVLVEELCWDGVISFEFVDDINIFDTQRVDVDAVVELRRIA